MAISYVGTGTESYAVNSATTPGLPIGLAEGDLLVLLDGIVSWHGNTAAPAVPSGWTLAGSFLHPSSPGFPRLTWMYRYYQAGDTAPTVGNSQTSVHYSTILAFRGVNPGTPTDVLGTASPNARLKDIGPIEGVTTTQPGGIVLVGGVRATDWGSVATLTGDGLTWSEEAEFTAYGDGSNIGVVLDYALTPSPITVADKTFVVSTGNTNEAVGWMWALAPNPDAGEPEPTPDTGAFFAFF